MPQHNRLHICQTPFAEAIGGWYSNLLVKCTKILFSGPIVSGRKNVGAPNARVLRHFISTLPATAFISISALFTDLS